ncbi:unnamed protein product [Nezara viridula]|uniref:Uncharacterized protein n=1 Tax=Nezara viridula TaxID=85310 RepID=A0A9P0HPP4_NEZVI|nr:unnamed protein product [Nezara viridula]
MVSCFERNGSKIQIYNVMRYMILPVVLYRYHLEELTLFDDRTAPATAGLNLNTAPPSLNLPYFEVY